MKNKMVALAVTMMVALLIAGFAYAHWEKIITVSGTVNTGNLNVTPSFHIEELDQDKDVASFEYCVDEEANSITVTLDNVYPCLTVEGYINFINDGTIPVHLVATHANAEGNLDIEYAGTEDETSHYEVTDVVEGETVVIANLWISYSEFDGETAAGYPQLDPDNIAYLDFELHFKQELPQDTTYTFTLEFEFWNWNEAPEP